MNKIVGVNRIVPARVGSNCVNKIEQNRNKYEQNVVHMNKIVPVNRIVPVHALLKTYQTRILKTFSLKNK